MESSRLPGPDCPIYMVMCLYWLKATPTAILSPGKETWKPPRVRNGWAVAEERRGHMQSSSSKNGEITSLQSEEPLAWGHDHTRRT